MADLSTQLPDAGRDGRARRRHGEVADVSEDTVLEERCETCRYVMMGMILPSCSNRRSEFYGGVVHPDGYCSWYELAREGHEPE